MTTLAPTQTTILTQQCFSRKALSDLLARGIDVPGGESTFGFLKALKANMIKGGSVAVGKQAIAYTPSRKKAGQLGYGRVYGTKSSLEMCQSEIRATLCGELYHDLDIVNAQPTLLLQFARKQHGIRMPFLKEYVRNRETVLAGISDVRGDAKDEVLKVLFGGRPRPDSDFLQALHTEIRGLVSQLVEKPEYKDLWAACRSEDNKYGSFLAHVTQTIERSCMLAMKKALEDMGWSVDVLVFDGVMPVAGCQCGSMY